MVSGTVESYGCVHLILKDGTWVIVRLRRLPAATGLSLCFLFHVVHGQITHTPIYPITVFYFRFKLYAYSHRKPCVRYFGKLSKFLPHGISSKFYYFRLMGKCRDRSHTIFEIEYLSVAVICCIHLLQTRISIQH